VPGAGDGHRLHVHTSGIRDASGCPGKTNVGEKLGKAVKRRSMKPGPAHRDAAPTCLAAFTNRAMPPLLTPARAPGPARLRNEPEIALRESAQPCGLRTNPRRNSTDPIVTTPIPKPVPPFPDSRLLPRIAPAWPALPDPCRTVLEPGFQCVRTQWIRGFHWLPTWAGAPGTVVLGAGVTWFG